MNKFDQYQFFVEKLMLNRAADKGCIIPEDVCCLGLAGELGEVADLIANGPLDCDKMILELGDLLWYVTALGWHYDVKLADLYGDGDAVSGLVTFSFRMDASLLMTTARLTASLGAVCDHIKKVRWAAKEPDPALVRRGLRDAVAYIRIIAYQHGATVHRVLDSNVIKLRARHPAGYEGGEGNRAAG